MSEHSPLPNRAARRAATSRARRLAALGSGAVLATGAAGAVTALVGNVPSAGAATTIVVANTDDAGPGSLRQALLDANPGDTIDLTGLSGTIQLSTGALEIDTAVTITGPGASVLSVRGDGSDRVFFAYADFGGATTTVSGITITNGGPNAPGDRGGAGFHFNCDGGTGNVVFDGVVVTGNTDDRLGAGLYFDRCSNTGTMTVTNSVVSGNSTTSGGGAIWFDDGTDLTIANTTIANNTAEYYSGGGVIFWGAGGVNLLNSTISGNSAGTRGGGIVVNRGTGSSITNSTIANNSATGANEQFGPGQGGGIALTAGDMTIVQSTISGNTASGIGDGLYIYGDARSDAESAASAGQEGHERPVRAAAGSVATVVGSIIAGNDDGTDDIGSGSTDSGAELTSSVIGGVNTVPVTDNGGNQLNVTNPGLGALANNGGVTQTMALVAGSVAIDAGPATVPTFPGNEFDQRGAGFARVVNGKVDVGAFEVQAPEPIDLAPRFTG